MNGILIVSAIILGGLLLAVILWPFFDKFTQQDPKASSQIKFLRDYQQALYERERVLLNLKDLELDLSMQKLSDEDYESLRGQVLREAASIYQQLEKLENESSVLKAIDEDMASLALSLKTSTSPTTGVAS